MYLDVTEKIFIKNIEKLAKDYGIDEKKVRNFAFRVLEKKKCLFDHIGCT